MKSATLLRVLSLLVVVLCCIPVAAQAPAVTSSSPSMTREVAGAIACDPARTHAIQLRVKPGSSKVEVEVPASLKVFTGDCINWRAVAVSGKEKAVISAVRFTDQGGAKVATVCDRTTPTAECLVAIALKDGTYNYDVSVAHGANVKTSETLGIIINPCFPPMCRPNAISNLVTGMMQHKAPPK